MSFGNRTRVEWGDPIFVLQMSPRPFSPGEHSARRFDREWIDIAAEPLDVEFCRGWNYLCSIVEE
jgi:hypothetical protein